MTERWQDMLEGLPTEQIDSCVLCEHVAGVEDRRWKSLLALPDPYAVQRCAQCGLRWLSPRPNPEGYRLLYSHESYFSGVGASPADYRDVVATRLDYFRQRLARVANILRRGTPLSVLDFGAATGEFVALAKSEGHWCEGIELSDDARATAKRNHGLSLLAPDQIQQLELGQFDVLHMNHVLEHMPDPLADLRACVPLLKSDGLLVIEVPQQFDNALDGLRRILRLGGRQRRFDAYSLHHTYFFTPKNIDMMLHAAGSQVLVLRTFNPDKTPLWPPSLRNWTLRALLTAADRLYAGGNIVEAFARKYDNVVVGV